MNPRMMRVLLRAKTQTTDEAPQQVGDVMYRFKQASEKTFLTPFGEMELFRNLFQADEGGPSYVPLDAMWGMVGEFASVEVREGVLFAVSKRLSFGGE